MRRENPLPPHCRRAAGWSRAAACTALAAGVAALTLVAGVARAQTTSRPNVLLFYVDDLRHDGLGVTGHPFVETPNLDQRVAGQGVNFRNSFVNCPLCSPSRASLMTGQYAAMHGYYGNDRLNAVPDERLPIYQNALRTAGYRTGLVGKWHMDSYFEPRASFDYWAAFQGQGVHNNPQLRVKKDAAAVSTVNETGYTTTILTDYALDFLKDYGTGGTRSEPFALTLSFKAVHAPWGRNTRSPAAPTQPRRSIGRRTRCRRTADSPSTRKSRCSAGPVTVDWCSTPPRATATRSARWR